MKHLFSVVICLSVLSPLVAQPATSKKPAAVPNAVLSELEQVKLENMNLKMSMLYQSENQIQSSINTMNEKRIVLLKQLEAGHPGYVWHEAEREGEVSGLLPIPAKEKPPVKPDAPTIKK